METFQILLTTTFYPPYHLGGDATHVKYLAEELAKRGHEVHVLCNIDAYKLKRKKQISQIEAEKKNISVHRISAATKQLDPFLTYVLGRSTNTQKMFSKIVNQINPDVVHHHNISLLGYSILEKKGQYTSFYTAHDYWPICQTNNLLTYKYRVCTQKNCAYCSLRHRRFPQFWRQLSSFKNAFNDIDLLISPSDYVKKQLVKEIKKNTIVLPNFAVPPPTVFSNLDFSNYFLFVGMLEPHKGIIQLLNLFCRHSFNTKLIIAGGGSLENFIRKYIEKNSLEKRVIFLGFVPRKELYTLYKNAKALIVPSIWPENAPLVTLEAISVGTPVIVSNQGGLPEIANKVDSRLIFNDFNELEDILLNFDKMDIDKQMIKETFNNNFSADYYVEAYLKLIQKAKWKK